MKLTRKEFEAQLALAKSLPVAAYAAMILTLKSAQVVEVDDKGVETPITVEIVETTPATTTDTSVVTPPAAPDAKGVPNTADVKAMVDQAVAAANANRNANPLGITGAGGTAGGGTKAFTIPAEIKRTRVKNFAAKQIAGLDAEERAFQFGMWCLAVRGSDTAKAFCREHGIGIEKAATAADMITKLHSEGVNNAGGFLVPEQFKTDIIDLKEIYGVARQMFNNEPMTSDTAVRPRRKGGLVAYPVGEGQAGTESTTQWEQVRLTAKDWMVLTRMTNQLNADSIISWADRLAAEISYAFTLAEDQAAFVGDGSVAFSGVTGLTTKLVNTFGTGGGAGLIQQSGAGGWVNAVLGDFDAMVGALPEYADTPNASWICHRSFYYGVIEKLVQASGGVPAMEVREGNRRPRPLFKGYPVVFSQIFPSAYATQTCPITLGDHSLAADFGDRQQDQITFADQASIGGQSLFERNEMGVRGVERFDINVHDVGTAGTPGVAGPVVGLILK